MKLKWLKNPNPPKYNKEKLYQLATKEACAQLVLNGVYNTYQSAYQNVMKKAKKSYLDKTLQP